MVQVVQEEAVVEVVEEEGVVQIVKEDGAVPVVEEDAVVEKVWYRRRSCHKSRGGALVPMSEAGRRGRVCDMPMRTAHARLCEKVSWISEEVGWRCNPVLAAKASRVVNGYESFLGDYQYEAEVEEIINYQHAAHNSETGVRFHVRFPKRRVEFLNAAALTGVDLLLSATKLHMQSRFLPF